MDIAECEVCKTRFKKKMPWHRYCSAECRKTAKKARYDAQTQINLCSNCGKQAPKFQQFCDACKTRTDICAYCGKSFSYLSYRRRKRRKFCGKGCYNKYYSKANFAKMKEDRDWYQKLSDYQYKEIEELKAKIEELKDIIEELRKGAQIANS
jgi:hypothetical protein